MLTTVAALFSVFTSGAGGGLLGGVFGLFKQSQERKERVDMARINLERDQLEYSEAQKERTHSLTMLKAGASIELEKVQTETEAEIEVSHQNALSSAQDALKGLNTTTGMDNFRASVRPMLAYWAVALFSGMLIWAFIEYSDTISDGDGKEILLGMFGTLTFIVTSVTSFYYVSRRNTAP
jgi:hypothetical protein